MSTSKSNKIDNNLIFSVNPETHQELSDSDYLTLKDKNSQLAPGTYRCARCNFIFYELRELEKHWEEAHVKVANATEHDRQIGEMLKMNIVPLSSLSIIA